MNIDQKIQRIAAEKAPELKSLTRRIKVKSIFKKFGYKTRNDNIAHQITMDYEKMGLFYFLLLIN